jgi:hypothetical protein
VNILIDLSKFFKETEKINNIVKHKVVTIGGKVQMKVFDMLDTIKGSYDKGNVLCGDGSKFESRKLLSEEVDVDTENFTQILTSSEDTVQKALDVLDKLVIGNIGCLFYDTVRQSPDGVITEFTVMNKQYIPGQMIVSVNGQITSAYDLTDSELGIITFHIAPLEDDVIYIHHIKNALLILDTVFPFPDGTEIEFVVNNGIYVENKIIVMVNGIITDNFIQTNPQLGIITFNDPPLLDDEIYILSDVNDIFTSIDVTPDPDGFNMVFDLEYDFELEDKLLFVTINGVATLNYVFAVDKITFNDPPETGDIIKAYFLGGK